MNDACSRSSKKNNIFRDIFQTSESFFHETIWPRNIHILQIDYFFGLQYWNWSDVIPFLRIIGI